MYLNPVLMRYYTSDFNLNLPLNFTAFNLRVYIIFIVIPYFAL